MTILASYARKSWMRNKVSCVFWTIFEIIHSYKRSEHAMKED